MGSLLTGEMWGACLEHVRDLMMIAGIREMEEAHERVLNASLRVVSDTDRRMVQDWFGEMTGDAWARKRVTARGLDRRRLLLSQRSSQREKESWEIGCAESTLGCGMRCRSSEFCLFWSWCCCVWIGGFLDILRCSSRLC